MIGGEADGVPQLVVYAKGPHGSSHRPPPVLQLAPKGGGMTSVVRWVRIAAIVVAWIAAIIVTDLFMDFPYWLQGPMPELWECGELSTSWFEWCL